MIELTRVTRCLPDLLKAVNALEQRGINLPTLREKNDTITATGHWFAEIMGAMCRAEGERLRDSPCKGTGERDIG